MQQPDEAGCLRPVGYDSQTLNDAERGYDIHDRELLAVVRGLLAWHHLLVGSPHKIRVLTDHLNLKYYRHPQKISRRVTHYLPKMAEFDFELVYKPGSTNKVDHLSRRPDYDDSSLDNQDVTVLPPHLFIHASSISALEQLVLHDRVLQQPHPDRPYTLEVDASQYTTGAILQQPDEAGHLCPMGYDSQTLNDAERGYNIHDRELLTVI